MNAQSAAAAGESAETTSTQEAIDQEAGGAEQPPPAANQTPGAATAAAPEEQQLTGGAGAEEEPAGSLLEDVLTQIDAPEEFKQTPKGKKQGAGGKEPGGKPAAAETAPAAKPPGKEDEDHPIPDEWPESARAQVMEERKKRQARTTALETERTNREQAEKRVKELEDQLAAAPAVQVAPSPQDPLAHINTPEELQAEIERVESALEFTRLHPNGAVDAVIGKDPKTGEPITRDFSADEIAKAGIQLDRILRRFAPAKAAFLQVQDQVLRQAKTDYPDLFNKESQMHKEAQQILKQLPEIKRFPDWPLWIGDAITRRNERRKTAGTPSPTVKALLEPKPAKAPPVTLNRSTNPRVASQPARQKEDGEIAAAEQAAIESAGDPDAMQDLVDQLLDQGATSQGGRQPALA